MSYVKTLSGEDPSGYRSKKPSTRGGFTLVELMVVVMIIGIVTTLAIPKFKLFQAKAMQAEAKNNLKLIYALEQAYFAENSVYAALHPVGYRVDNGDSNLANRCNQINELGFRLKDCLNVRYAYKVGQIDGSGSISDWRSSLTDASTFSALATTSDEQMFTGASTSPLGGGTVFVGCYTADAWSITPLNHLVNLPIITSDDGTGDYSEDGLLAGTASQMCFN